MNGIRYNWNWERIDTRLSSNLPYSRSFFHHIIERGWIKVWNKIIKKSYKLKYWDKIIIDDLKRYLSPVVLQEAPNIKIPIILEKEDYLVINKPKWVLSHPNSVRDVNQPSIVWFLYHNFKELPSIWNFIRAGLVHRLDKDTNWLMIIAKTEKWLAHFKKLFKAKSESEELEQKESAKIKKRYKATSILTILGEEFLKKIKNKLPHYIQEMVHPKVPNSIPKMGITKILSFWYLLPNELSNNIYDWELNENKEGLVKLDLEILTWRTHQIRYHLSNHWLPIYWDYLYWKEEIEPMQLTAYKLEFTDPDWEKIILEI